MITLNHITFSYKINPERKVLDDISLEIPRGQVVLLAGASGCGKSTLLRVINGLIPNYYEGELQGDALLDLGDGPKSIPEIPLYDMAKYSGTVFQNPKSQFFNVDTDSELAFTLENLGTDVKTIRKRISVTSEKFHLQPLLGRSLFSLSGGEKQKIACASVDIAGTELLLLDEPVANLDEDSITDLHDILAEWKSEGKTILIAEHRVAWILDLVDRVVLMHEGKIQREFTREEFSQISDNERRTLGLRSLRNESVKDAREEDAADSADQLVIRNLRFAYRRGSPVLEHKELRLPLHKVVAVIGPNGSGKTTLFRCLAGMETNWKGTVWRDGRKISRRELAKSCFMVMQDVGNQLFTESVLEEVLISLKNRDENRAREILAGMDLAGLEERHPRTLSGGQKQRLAVACAVASDCDILLFDEPTAGLDYYHMKQTAQLLKELSRNGKSVFVITHDVELIQEGGCVPWKKITGRYSERKQTPHHALSR